MNIENTPQSSMLCVVSQILAGVRAATPEPMTRVLVHWNAASSIHAKVAVANTGRVKKLRRMGAGV